MLALAWTIVMIWGSVWALTGRTRVMLLVGGSIALALTAFSFFGTLADLDSNTTSSVVWALVLLLVSLAVVVLLSLPAAGRWFAGAAHCVVADVRKRTGSMLSALLRP